MNYLLHGDYNVGSRDFLHGLTAQAKVHGKEVIYLNGEKTALNDLIQALTSSSLFGSDKTIVIENLFSRIKSKEQEGILTWLHSYQDSSDVILWEKKPIGKVAQRKLPPKTTVKEFKTPALIFKLVELLSPKTKKKALVTLEMVMKTEPIEFVFLMIVRQVRLLLLIKTGQNVAGAPWIVGKLKKQAVDYSLEHLLTSYQKLYIIDTLVKTGQTIMPLQWHVSVWISEL